MYGLTKCGPSWRWILESALPVYTDYIPVTGIVTYSIMIKRPWPRAFSCASSPPCVLPTCTIPSPVSQRGVCTTSHLQLPHCKTTADTAPHLASAHRSYCKTT